MKKMLLYFLCLLSAGIFCSCTLLKEVVQQHTETQNTVQVLDSVFPQGYQYWSAEDFTQPAGETAFAYQQAETSAQQYEQVLEAVESPKTAVLMVGLKETSFVRRILYAAKEQELPVLFYGVQPSAAQLNSYDKCWYVGFNTELLAEKQASLLVSAFRNGKLVDQTGDYKQTGLLVQTQDSSAYTTASYAQSIAQNIELGGIHIVFPNDPVLGVDTKDSLNKLQQLLLPQTLTISAEEASGESSSQDYGLLQAPQSETEIFVCGDLPSSEAVLQLLEDLAQAAADEAQQGIATPARSYTVVCFGESEKIQTAVNEGTVLGSVTPDFAQAQNALRALSENLVRHESITKNTEYHLENGKNLILDYQILCPEQEQS